MFVELVSPDVMYNNVEWPDLENIKYTIERLSIYLNLHQYYFYQCDYNS